MDRLARYSETNDPEICVVLCQTAFPDLRSEGKNTVSAMHLAVIRSGYGSQSEVYKKGFSDYLTYPFISDEVHHRIKSLNALRMHNAMMSEYSQDDFVNRACRFLRKNITFDKGIEELARAVGTNRNLLNQRFNLVYGEGPITWLRRQRIKLAADLIKNTEQSVIDIAQSVGYFNANNFSTAFRREYGCSPREFRKKCKNQKI